ncbi:hypothetical protein Tco_0612736 [Tanacetum coccineum]
MVKRMASATHRDNMVIPDTMLLSRIFRHVGTFQPYPFTPDYTLTPHVMVPLGEERVKRSTGKGKRAHPPTNSSSSQSDDPSLPSSNLSPNAYIRELPYIENASAEFKQMKGTFKCIGKTLSKLKKKLDK